MTENPKYSIMIVEDEAIIRENLADKLSSLSPTFYVKFICKNGEDAINAIEESPVDIVITDIRMPVMDGLELIKSLYFSHSSIRTILLSGYSEFEYARLALKYNVREYLLKPIDTTELINTLNRLQIELEQERNQCARFPLTSNTYTSHQLADLVKSYIASNFTKDISLSIIADEVGYSPEHLGRIFKKHHGQSVLKFITHLRINEAKKLLASVPPPDIGTVGQRVGYTDPLYFSRVFKKNVGIYPKEYLRNQGR